MSEWWSAHTHSHFSTLDGLPDVPRLVARAEQLEYPAFALTDHGVGSGWVQLYKECNKRDILPFPGVEVYVLDPAFDGPLEEAGKAGRFHLGLIALDLKGYQALARFMTLTHTRPRFSRFPRCTLGDLGQLGKEAGKHIAVTTGCYFGMAQQAYVRDGTEQAMRVVSMLAAWFPHTFVEVQNHSIDHDEDETIAVSSDDVIVEAFYDIANLTGLPLIATQDSHYCEAKEKTAHGLMKKMVYGSVEDMFPGDSFHLASEEWVSQHYDDHVWEASTEGLDHLLSLHKLRIPPLDKFKTHVPVVSNKPDRLLRTQCMKALHKYLLSSGRTKYLRVYLDRLNYELGTIADLGMGNYFLAMLDDINWCRNRHYAVEARGSANGSLVCFLLTITQVDPIIWGTSFDRFLSPDRIKPPDVDMDIEDVARGPLLKMLHAKRECLQIGTYAELGAREADQRGSVMATYIQYLRRTCIEDAKEKERRLAEKEDRKPVMGKAEDVGKATFKAKYGWIQSLDDVRKHDEEDWRGLVQLARMKSVRKSYGTHASGILMAGDGMTISDWIPTMLVASSDTPVTQYTMDDVEEFGLTKADWLGQKTLTIMRTCQELMGRSDPTDFTWIPLDDRDACKLLREGRTDTGIFHFEGYTKAKGGYEVGVRNTKDAVLVQALYMPGAMESGQKDLYVRRRKSKEARDNIDYLHPVFESALKDTHGAVIFQEQPMAVLRGIGMSVVSVNSMLKVVKDSGKGAVERNRKRLAELHDEFDELAIEAGIGEADLDEAWHLTTGFMNYGFNMAHATGYGIRSYRCAYLKAHYPLEFMTALLQSWSGDKKEVIYAREARRIGLRIAPPDVNTSSGGWSLDRRSMTIRKGLMSVDGIGPEAAVEIGRHAPYKRITDIAKRCDTRKVTGGKAWLEEKTLMGKLKALEDAGALDTIDHS